MNLCGLHINFTPVLTALSQAVLARARICSNIAHNFVKVLCLCPEGESLSFLVEVAALVALGEEITVTSLSVHLLYLDF